jgi:hypothetical protein
MKSYVDTDGDVWQGPDEDNLQLLDEEGNPYGQPKPRSWIEKHFMGSELILLEEN